MSFGKNIILSLLIGLVFVLNFDKGMVIAMFFANQAQIAEKYCENKDKPKLKCDGKCHLAKQLQQEPTPTAPLPDFSSCMEFIAICECNTTMANLVPLNTPRPFGVIVDGTAHIPEHLRFSSRILTPPSPPPRG